MTKIFVNKSEPIASILRKIQRIEDGEVTLVIPRNALLKETVENFATLRRECAAAGKTFRIESVDGEILALAKVTNIPADHPLFRDEGGPAISDIVSGTRGAAALRTPQSFKEKKAVLKTPDRAARSEGSPIKATPPSPATVSQAAPSPAPARGVTVRLSPAEKPAIPWRKFAVIGIVGAFVVLGFVVAIAAKAAGRVQITLRFEKSPWQNEQNVVADKMFAEINIGNRTLPAELFIQEKNATQLFPASGRATVSEKAKGRITIYNAYSSAPQKLVATTRFETPDGKVFRLDAQVTVPGAQIKDGKIISSNVEAAVTADKPGEGHNLGPIERLTIPGFKGSPRYGGFYGEIKVPTRGGYVGEKAVPSEGDITEAKKKASDILRSALQSNLLNKIPEDFKIIEGASNIEITRLSVNTATNEEGSFSVFGEAAFRGVGFKESDLRALFLAISGKDFPAHAFRDITVNYRDARADFEKGHLTFRAEVNATLEPSFDEEAFLEKIEGMAIQETRQELARLSELEHAKISLWPFWMRKVPRDHNKINIVIE